MRPIGHDGGVCLLLGEEGGAVGALRRVAAQGGSRVIVGPDRRASDAEKAIENSFAACPESGHLDVVFHVIERPVWQRTSLSDWALADWTDRVMGPLRGAFLVGRRAVEEFLSHGEGGRLVYFVVPGNSDGADEGVIRSALLAFVRSIAKEYGSKEVTCNIVFAAGPDEASVRAASQVAWSLIASADYLTGEAVDLVPEGV